MNDFTDLAEKIARAKRILPMPELMTRIGLRQHATKGALCPWHDDQHASFSVFQGKDGFWHYKCFVCDSRGGDEIALVVKHLNVSKREAIRSYLEMAGFPTTGRPKSRECPKPRQSPESPKHPENPLSPVLPESPMSNGQELDEELRALAARSACTERKKPVDETWKVARELRAVQLRIRRKLGYSELMQTFNEWHRLSQPFLDPAKSHGDYLAALLVQLGKVRVPTSQGDTLTRR
jgi:hypothetical protein